MNSEHDREYLEQLAAKIDQLGVEVEHRSNLVAVASRLHHLRTHETDPQDKDRLDLEIDAVMAAIEGGRDEVDDLRQRLLTIAEGAVETLAAAGGA